MAIPIEVRHIDPDWADCVGGINGVYDPPIALTPASAIAKPTLPGGASKTVLEAVPASTPRPTLVTVTPALGSDQFSAQPSTSKVQKPSPDGPHIGESSMAAKADDEQTAKQDSSPKHHATVSIVNALPTEISEEAGRTPVESTILDEPESAPESPNDWSKSHATNAAPKTQTDALSVLLETQSSIDASIHQQGTVGTTQWPYLSAIQMQPAQTFESVSAGIRLSAAPGSEVSPGPQVLHAASDGGANIIDHSVTYPMPSSNVRLFTLATFLAGDDAITAYRQGSLVLLADGTQTLTAQFGSAVTIGSHSINIADDGHALVFGASTIDLPSNNESENDVSATIQPADGPVSTAVEITASQIGQQLRASASENRIIVQQGASMVTLPAGQQTTFNGHTLSVVQSGSALMDGGSVMTIAPTGVEYGASNKVQTTSDGRSANAADATGATNTEEVTASTSSTPQSSTAQDNAALGLMANTNLFLRLLCLIVCIYASVALV